MKFDFRIGILSGVEQSLYPGPGGYGEMWVWCELRGVVEVLPLWERQICDTHMYGTLKLHGNKVVMEYLWLVDKYW